MERIYSTNVWQLISMYCQLSPNGVKNVYVCKELDEFESELVLLLVAKKCFKQQLVWHFQNISWFGIFLHLETCRTSLLTSDW